MQGLWCYSRLTSAVSSRSLLPPLPHPYPHPAVCGCPCLCLAVSGCIIMSLSGCLWLHMWYVSGCVCIWLHVSGCPFLCLAVSGCACVCLAVSSYSVWLTGCLWLFIKCITKTTSLIWIAIFILSSHLPVSFPESPWPLVGVHNPHCDLYPD